MIAYLCCSRPRRTAHHGGLHSSHRGHNPPIGHFADIKLEHRHLSTDAQKGSSCEEVESVASTPERQHVFPLSKQNTDPPAALDAVRQDDEHAVLLPKPEPAHIRTDSISRGTSIARKALQHSSLQSCGHTLRRKASLQLLRSSDRISLRRSGSRSTHHQHSSTEEERERRAELKRALHERLRADLLDDVESNESSVAPFRKQEQMTESTAMLANKQTPQSMSPSIAINMTSSKSMPDFRLHQRKLLIPLKSTAFDETHASQDNKTPYSTESPLEISSGSKLRRQQSSHLLELSKSSVVSQYKPPEWRLHMQRQQHSKKENPTVGNESASSLTAIAVVKEPVIQQQASTSLTTPSDQSLTEQVENNAASPIECEDPKRSFADLVDERFASPSRRKSIDKLAQTLVSPAPVRVTKRRRKRPSIAYLARLKSSSLDHGSPQGSIKGRKTSSQSSRQSIAMSAAHDSKQFVSIQYESIAKTGGENALNRVSSTEGTTVDLECTKASTRTASTVTILPEQRRPHQSRFREEFDMNSMPLSEGLILKTELLSVDGPFDGHLHVHGHHNGQHSHHLHGLHRRGARGSSPLARNEDEAAGLWEKALQMHRWDVSAERQSRREGRQSIVPTSQMAPTSFTTRANSRRRQSMMLQQQHLLQQPDLESGPVHGELRGRPRIRLESIQSVSTGNLAPDELPPKVRSVSSQPALPRPDGSWARYPSHTKEVRTGSAGATDRVSVQDFAPRSSSSIRSTTAEGQGGKDRRSRSQEPQTVFQRISSKYRQELSEFRRLERGYRSSVSAGGNVEYPDLEMLPNLESRSVGRRASWAASDLDERGREGSESLLESRDAEVEQSDGASDDYVVDVRKPSRASLDNRRSAGAWARMYSTCVADPQRALRSEVSGAAGSHVDSGSESHGDGRSVAKPARVLCSLSTDSGLDVRASTLDFERSLRLHETASRLRALKVVDQVWGDERKGMDGRSSFEQHKR